MVNTSYVSELIEQGDIAQLREALDQSLSPGSQSFEQALYKLVKDGRVAQDEALANADSATNLLWLLNNGPDSWQAGEAERKPAPPEASCTEFTLNG